MQNVLDQHDILLMLNHYYSLVYYIIMDFLTFLHINKYNLTNLLHLSNSLYYLKQLQHLINQLIMIQIKILLVIEHSIKINNI